VELVDKTAAVAVTCITKLDYTKQWPVWDRCPSQCEGPAVVPVDMPAAVVVTCITKLDYTKQWPVWDRCPSQCEGPAVELVDKTAAVVVTCITHRRRRLTTSELQWAATAADDSDLQCHRTVSRSVTERMTSTCSPTHTEPEITPSKLFQLWWWFETQVKIKLRRQLRRVLNGIPSQSYGVSLVIRDHTALPSTRTHPNSHPSK